MNTKIECLVLVLVLAFCVELDCKGNDTGHKHTNNTGVNLLDNIKTFVNEYREKLPSWKVKLKLPERQNMRRFLQKQHHLPTSFEELERLYWLKESFKLLDEFIGYAEEVNNDTETRTFFTEFREHEQEKLKRMSITQIKEYIASIRKTLQSGVSSRHQVSIGGHTYSLNHISDWCCNFGG